MFRCFSIYKGNGDSGTPVNPERMVEFPISEVVFAAYNLVKSTPDLLNLSKNGVADFLPLIAPTPWALHPSKIIKTTFGFFTLNKRISEGCQR